MEDKNPKEIELEEIQKQAEEAFDEQVEAVEVSEEPNDEVVEKPTESEESTEEKPVDEKQEESEEDKDPETEEQKAVADEKEDATDDEEDKSQVEPEVKTPEKPNVFAKGEFTDDDWEKTPDSVRSAVKRVTTANAKYFARREETFKEVDPFLFQNAKQHHISKDEVLRNCAKWAQDMTDNTDGAFLNAIENNLISLNHPEVVVNYLINRFGMESETLKPVEIDRNKSTMISETEKLRAQNIRNERTQVYEKEHSSYTDGTRLDSDIATFVEMHPEDARAIDQDKYLEDKFFAEVRHQKSLDQHAHNVAIMERAANIVLNKVAPTPKDTVKTEISKPKGLKTKGKPVSIKPSTAGGEPAKGTFAEGFSNQIDEFNYIKKVAESI